MHKLTVTQAAPFDSPEPPVLPTAPFDARCTCGLAFRLTDIDLLHAQAYAAWAHDFGAPAEQQLTSAH